MNRAPTSATASPPASLSAIMRFFAAYQPALNLLALDTSSDVCAAAIVRADGAVFTREALARNQHSNLLLPMVAELLTDAKLLRRDIGAIAVGVGPGSFTGIRIAVGAGQGLAIGLGVPMIALDSLLLLAEAARAEHGCHDFVAALDARMQQTFAARYRWQAGGWQVLVAPLQCSFDLPDRVLQRAQMGVGSAFAADIGFADRLSIPKADGTCGVTAQALASIARFAAANGVFMRAADIAPVYVREKVATTIAERALERA